MLHRRVDFYTIDTMPARWRGGAGSSPLDGASTAASSPRNDSVKNCRVHPTHWLISTQPGTPRKVKQYSRPHPCAGGRRLCGNQIYGAFLDFHTGPRRAPAAVTPPHVNHGSKPPSTRSSRHLSSHRRRRRDPVAIWRPPRDLCGIKLHRREVVKVDEPHGT